MPERLIYDPAVWVAIKLFGAVMFLLTAFGAYEHKRITTQGKRIGENDKTRQEKCMTKEQCVTNREYMKDMLDKIYDGQIVIHERVDVIHSRSTQRRKEDN